MRIRRPAGRPGSVARTLTAGCLAALSIAGLARAASVPGHREPTALAAPGAWTRSEAAAAAVRDLALRLKLEEARVRIVSATDETWRDATFGCTGRKPLTEPVPVPGYAVTLAVDDRLYRYRTDRAGTLRRCDGVKPVAPIERHR